MSTNISNRSRARDLYSGARSRGINSDSYVSNIPRRQNAYKSVKGDATMPANKPAENSGYFSVSGVIVGVAGLAICALLSIVWSNLSNDISDLKQGQKTTTQTLSDTKVDIVKSISAVEKQIIQTNQKLESFIEEMRKKR